MEKTWSDHRRDKLSGMLFNLIQFVAGTTIVGQVFNKLTWAGGIVASCSVLGIGFVAFLICPRKGA